MSIVLLCHCDGTSGSTGFVDTSGFGHVLTPANVTVDTATPKFGSGCAKFTGSNAALTVDNPAAFNLGSQQFTIEAWAYFTVAPSGVQAVAAQFGGSSNLGWFFGTVNGPLAFYYSTGGTDNPNVGGAASPALNSWVHLAVDRDSSNVIRVYANGGIVASATVSAGIFPSSRACIIGNDENLSRAFPGKLDEVQIDVGLARYAGPFTPPVAPFSDPVRFFSAEIF